MSLATRCPVCNTVFRVHAEQLAARGGRVRCGQCNHVFDGVSQLVTDAATETPPPAPPASHADVARDETERAAEPEHAAEYEHAQPNADADYSPAIDDALPPANVPDEHLPLQDDPGAADPQDRESSQPVDAQSQSEPLAAEVIATRNPYSTGRRDAMIGQGAPFDLGTVAPPPAPAQVPGYRVLWGLLGLLALVALAVQGTWRYRTELGVLWPDARPYLEAACEFAGCTLRLPRHAELLAIESSDLQRDAARETLIVLNVVLRNRAQFPQEFPALELTLTDESSNAVVRRVLKPADYLDPRGLDRAQAEGLRAGGEARLSVRLDASKVRASGYQLYLFYP